MPVRLTVTYFFETPERRDEWLAVNVYGGAESASPVEPQSQNKQDRDS